MLPTFLAAAAAKILRFDPNPARLPSKGQRLRRANKQKSMNIIQPACTAQPYSGEALCFFSTTWSQLAKL